MPFKYASLVDRIKANSIPTKVPGVTLKKPCRLWTGSLNASGYPKMTMRTRYRDKKTGHKKIKSVLAHRVALAHYSSMPVWRLNYCCHMCDQRACVEPTHLLSKSQKWNMRDMVAKSRNKNMWSE